MKRYVVHLIVSILIGGIFLMILDVPSNMAVPFIVICIIGALIPDLDVKLKLGHRNPIMHSFLIPFFLSLILPKHILVTAFFVGFASHMIADLGNPKQRWILLEEKTGTLLLWVSAIFIIMLIFNLNFAEVWNLFR